MISEKQINNWFAYHSPVKLAEDPGKPGSMIQVPDEEKIARIDDMPEVMDDIKEDMNPI